jgi:outer membrane protein TolC
MLTLWTALLLPAQVGAQQRLPEVVVPEPVDTPPSQAAPERLDAPEESLEDAWRSALSVDQRLEAARWNVESATRSRAAAQAERFPSLTVGADYLVLSQQAAFNLPASPVLPGQLPFLQQDSGGFHAVVTQPLYTFGAIASGINAAEAEVAADQSEMERTRLDVKMNVAEYFIAVLRAGRSVEVAASRVTSLASHSQDVGSLLDRGLVSRNDLLSAQLALADARQQLLQARNGLELAWAYYNRALGRPLTQPVKLQEPQIDRVAGDVQQLTSQAIRNRPEIAELSAQAVKLREQAAALNAKKAPQIKLIGGYLYQQDRYIDPNGVAGVAVDAEWNLFDSGRVSNQAAALCEKAESLIRTRKDTESLVALEVRQKWLELQTAVQRLEVARQATLQAEENLRVARQRYQEQVGTNTEVLDAETLRVQAYTNLYNSTYEAVLARLRLSRGVGNL